MPDPAHPLTLWLARACVVLYALALLIYVCDLDSTSPRFKLWRVVWSAACLFLIVHVLSAFHLEHGWSHAAAIRHTAEQTARVTGIDWSGGLYFNYAFVIMWGLDVGNLWRSPPSGRSILRRTTDLACLFMIFNATIVFGPKWWIGPVAAFGLIAFLLRRRVSVANNHDRTSEG